MSVSVSEIILLGYPYNYLGVDRKESIRKPATAKQVADIFKKIKFLITAKPGTENYKDRIARWDAIEVGDPSIFHNVLEDTKLADPLRGTNEGESLLRQLNYIFDSNAVHDDFATDTIAGENETRTIGSVTFPFPYSERHIPKVHVELIEEIIYDAYLNEEGGSVGLKDDFHAYAYAYGGSIGLSPDILGDIRDGYSDTALHPEEWLIEEFSQHRQRTSKSLIHELGHLVEMSETSFGKRKNNNAKDFLETAFRNADKSDTGFVSDYAKTNFQEFYAESYTAYIVNTEHLRSVNPDMFYYFEQTFNNKPIPYVGWKKRKGKVDYSWFNKDKSSQKEIIADPKEVGDPFDTTMAPLDDDFRIADSLEKSSDDDLSKLLALSTGLEYLSKQEPGKREYLAPGEEAPEGVRVERGQRGGRYYTPGVASSAVDRALADIETPEEEREIDVVTPDDEVVEQDEPTSNKMESPNDVNEYLDGVADKLETRLEEVVGEGYQPFLGKDIPLANLTADHITKVGFTDGSEEGYAFPTGLGIHSYENFTVTVASGLLGRQKKQFIYKMVKGESRGELLSYAIDRVLGLNVVPLVKQHSMDFFMLSDKFKQTHGENIPDHQLQELRGDGVGGNAGGHFQEFCDNCVSRDELYPVIAKMLSTAKGREEFFKIMLLDYITGNDDRHTGNYLITKDERIVAIDSGFAGGGQSYTEHQKKASLYLAPDRRNFDITFPYGLSNEMSQRYPDIVPTADDIKDEAGKFFDKYFDRSKLDAVLESINWVSAFRTGGPNFGQDMEDSEQTRAQFKDNFINVAAENMRVGFVGWEHDSYSYDDSFGAITPFDFSVKPRDSVLKRELATEGINIDVIHSLGFDGNPMVDESDPNIYEEDEFN